MIRRNRVHREALCRFWGRLDTVQRNQSWPASDGWELRQLPTNTSELLRDLLDEFGQEQLIESGIAEQETEGQLTMSGRLASGSAALWALADAEGGRPFDVLLPDGLLLGDEAPLYAAIHDYRMENAVRASEGLLLLVSTLDDTAFCHAFGLAAAPIAGMEQLNLCQLRQIEELTSEPDQLPLIGETEEPTADVTESDDAESASDTQNPGMSGNHSAARSEIADDIREECPSDDLNSVIDLASDDVLPLEIIFAGWSFARQQDLSGEHLREAIARLANAQRHLSVDLSGVAVWIPSQDDIASMRFCWEMRDADAVKQAVLESVDRACYNLAAVSAGEIAPWQTPGTYLEARSALSRGLRETNGISMDRSELVRAFEHLLQSQIIDPVVENGVNHRDPIVGALHMELGSISFLLQSQAPFLQHDLMQAGLQVESSDKRAALDSSIRIRMQLVDRLVRIARELRR